MFYRVPVHRGRSSISQSTDLWVCGKSAFSPTCEWTWTSVNTSCLPHPTDLPKFLDVTLWFLMDYVSKKIDVSRIQTAIQGVIICGSKLGLMLMHFIIRNRLSWPPVHLVSTLSLKADNGPSAEIHKTVSIFLRGKIYRSLVYPVVSKLGLHFFLKLYRCSNASSWNKMTKKLENEYILECMIMEGTKRHTARISTQGVFVERGMCLGSRKRTTSCHLGLPPFDIHAYLP